MNSIPPYFIFLILTKFLFVRSSWSTTRYLGHAVLDQVSGESSNSHLILPSTHIETGREKYLTTVEKQKMTKLLSEPVFTLEISMELY